MPSERTTVPVRLEIPRDPKQMPMQVSGSRWSRARLWALEIEKQAPGVDFHAEFPVPVYDVLDLSPEALEAVEAGGRDRA